MSYQCLWACKHVCMYVYMYVCTYVCIWIYIIIYIYLNICIYMTISIHMCMYVYIYIHKYIHSCMHAWCLPYIHKHGLNLNMSHISLLCVHTTHPPQRVYSSYTRVRLAKRTNRTPIPTSVSHMNESYQT